MIDYLLKQCLLQIRENRTSTALFLSYVSYVAKDQAVSFFIKSSDVKVANACQRKTAQGQTEDILLQILDSQHNDEKIGEGFDFISCNYQVKRDNQNEWQPDRPTDGQTPGKSDPLCLEIYAS